MFLVCEIYARYVMFVHIYEYIYLWAYGEFVCAQFECTRIHIHIYIHILMNMDSCVSVTVCTHVRVYVCVYVCAHVFVQTHVHTQKTLNLPSSFNYQLVRESSVILYANIYVYRIYVLI